MNKKIAIVLALVVTLFAILALLQRNQIGSLRVTREKLETEIQAQSAVSTATKAASSIEQEYTPPSELLALRSQVGQLERRRRELEAAVAQAKASQPKPRSEFASTVAGTPSDVPIPEGYIRTSEAQFVGFNTPENALQSFLWAMGSGDVTNVMNCMSSEILEQFKKEVAQNPKVAEQMEAAAIKLPGMKVIGRKEIDPQTVELIVTIAPGARSSDSEKNPDKIRFKQDDDGEWKMNSH